MFGNFGNLAGVGMARRTPYVADGVLRIPGLRGDPGIGVGSESWAAWLTDPATRSFSFRGSDFRYTARKERRSRGGEYWVAYLKRRGKLHKAYLGKPQNITLERGRGGAGRPRWWGHGETASGYDRG
jgi:LuxR family maltose regulon positive regulatory protein